MSKNSTVTKPSLLFSGTILASLMLFPVHTKGLPVSNNPLLLADQDNHHQLIPTQGKHEHETLEIPDNQSVPTVRLIVHPDSKKGWNLEIQVSNFTFAPEKVNQADQLGEGHAHLYVDGVKLTRLYGNWYYLENLSPGQHKITVILNTNTHKTLLYRGQPIEANVMLDVPPDQ
jgi:hypothetical protein